MAKLFVVRKIHVYGAFVLFLVLAVWFLSGFFSGEKSEPGRFVKSEGNGDRNGGGGIQISNGERKGSGGVSLGSGIHFGSAGGAGTVKDFGCESQHTSLSNRRYGR